MCYFEDKAKEYLEKYGVISVNLLMFKLKIKKSLATEIYHKLVQPIKVITPENSEKYHSPYSKKFWKSKKDFIM